MPAVEALPGGEPRCAGCAAKVGATVLAEALAAGRSRPHPAVLLGLDAADDAAVIATAPGEATVQSVDFFPAFIDDPWLFARIAAVHAFGDLHAMGARPVAALATAVLPYLHPRLQARDLAALIAGARSAIEADGAALAGGHSGEGAMLAFGLTAIGAVDPAKLMRKAGLRPGDRLILSKPLGTGASFAAAMRQRASGPDMDAVLQGMQQSLGPAARAAAAQGAIAATDVTGFGLAGHLLEMLRASGADAAIDLAALPAYDAALAALAAGIESTAAPGNRAAAEGFVAGQAGLNSVRRDLLFDPQTAGGLLFAVSPGRAEAARAAIGGDASIIGEVEPRRGHDPQIRLR
ncbi:selenide, water dikinase SelD [Desertibaculum subflavum]|uniref:selenide, water dikinase SelD n=1 Tax=Desertibaculum subflavum TaxID=2268458 RepID=UPI003F666648